MLSATDRHRRVLAALALSHLTLFFAVVVGLSSLDTRDGGWGMLIAMGTSVGIVLGQFLALCAWTALGTGNDVVRFLLGILVILLFMFTGWLAFQMPQQDPGATTRFDLRHAAFYVSLFTFVLIPYWMIRRLKGWRVEPTLAPHGRLDAVGTRFGVVDLLAWTAYVAVLLAVMKFMSNEMTPGEVVIAMLVYVAALLVPIVQSLILIWSRLGPGRANWKRHTVIVLALSLALTLFATLLMVQAWEVVMRSRSVRGVLHELLANWEESLLYGGISLGILLPLVFSVRLLGFAGYELRTVTRSGVQRGVSEST